MDRNDIRNDIELRDSHSTGHYRRQRRAGGATPIRGTERFGNATCVQIIAGTFACPGFAPCGANSRPPADDIATTCYTNAGIRPTDTDPGIGIASSYGYAALNAHYVSTTNGAATRFAELRDDCAARSEDHGSTSLTRRRNDGQQTGLLGDAQHRESGM